MPDLTQKDIDKAVKEATDGLLTKNKELLGKMKKLKDNMEAFEGVDIKALQKASNKLQKMEKENLEKEGEYKKLYEKLQQQHTELKDTFDTEKKQSTSKLNDVIKDGVVDSALLQVDVIGVLAESARAILVKEVAINDEGAAMVGDKDVVSYVKEWAATDIGKHFIKNGNAGGGAGGSGGGARSEAAYFDKKSDKFSLTEQAKLANTDPKLYTELKTAAGAGDK